MTRGIKNKCNENFFSQDTPDSFYWAGFIAADGCVSLEQNKYPRLKICLSNKDFNHLVKFKNSISFDGQIINRFGRTYLSIASEKIFSDLKRFNIVPRKTLIYSFPDIIEHPMVNHFMRGYFDGDGSFYIYKNKDSTIDNLAMNVCGTFDFLQVFRDILSGHVCLKNNIYTNSKIFMFGCKGNRKVKKISDFLYKNSNENNRLDRKFNIVNSDFFSNMPSNFRVKAVIGQNIITGAINEYASINDTALNGFDPKLVSMCCLGKRKTHKKYKWKFQ